MILNVSGRTDIVAFYSNWFINRLKAGFVDVRNPFNPKLVSRIYFKDVDLIVFCTKRPKALLNIIPLLDIPIIVHVTLTCYKSDIEVNVSDKKEIIEDVKEISRLIGKDKVFLRYDPVFFNNYYTLEYHVRAFKRLCRLLDGYIDRIIISFIDDYKNVRKNMDILRIRNLKLEELEVFATSFVAIAKEHNIRVQTCGEANNLVQYGFIEDDCISRSLAKKITGKDYPIWKSRKKEGCNCAEMVDIGVYNTCNHRCRYCYANFDEEVILDNMKKHDVNSSLLIGNIDKYDKIVVRKK